VVALDHVQLAAPPGCEEAARAFFGGVLGWPEIEKADALAGRGGVWFRFGPQQLHIGVQEGFVPATKARPAIAVEDLVTFRAHLEHHGVPVVDAEPLEGMDHFYAQDPFGNRLELLERHRARDRRRGRAGRRAFVPVDLFPGGVDR
jgi:catechol 2,3-dioxygenase-like lactoylglutathione lyase family enzyme